MFHGTPILQQSNHLLWKLFMMFMQVKWSVPPAGEHCQLCLLCGLSLAIHIHPFLLFPQHYKQVKSRRETMSCACEHMGCSSRFKTAFRNLSQKPEQRQSPLEKDWFFCAAFIRASLHTAEKGQKQTRLDMSDSWQNPKSGLTN